MDDFYKIIGKVERAYKGFSVITNGSKKDKFLYILLFLVLIASIIAFVITELESDNIIIQFIAIVSYCVSLILWIKMTDFFKRRENFLYQKGMSFEQEFLTFFIHALSRDGIEENMYSDIITHYEIRLEKEKNTKTNEMGIYCVFFFIPFLSAVFDKETILQVLLNPKSLQELLIMVSLFAVLATIILSGFILLIVLFCNRKKIMYTNIVCNLKMALNILEYNKKALQK